MYGQYQSPYLPSQYQQPFNNVFMVNGRDGAEAFCKQLPANSKAIVFDANGDYFYALSTDAGGYGTIDDFSFEHFERAHEQRDDAGADIAAILAEIRGMAGEIETLKEAINGKQPVQKQRGQSAD